MQAALAAVAVHEARKRIPDHMQGTNPYSVNALWSFYARTHHDPEGETCNYCSMFDGKTFTGDQLRSVFPDHYWEGDDIYPDVHKTLWGKEGTCACLLIRDDQKWGEPINLDLWSSIGTDWTKGPEEES